MSSDQALRLAEEELREAISVHQSLLGSPVALERLVHWARLCAESLSSGGAVFFAGNGGSFADAQHLAAELTGRMGVSRRPLAGIALGVNCSSISAIGNDFGFELTFSRELEGLYRPSSVLIALSTSGNSPNIVNLIDTGAQLDVPVLLLTGSDGGIAAQRCESIRVPSQRTERIQEVHILIGHVLCLLIERFLGLHEPELTE